MEPNGVSVEVATRQLEIAKTEAERRRRLNAKAEIIRISAEGSRIERELEPLRAQIKTALSERLKLNAALIQAKNMMGLYSAELDPLSFPTAKDERDRLRQLAAWEKRQQELQTANRANEELLRWDVRRHAMDLAKRLERLEQEIKNLSAISEGRLPGQIEGGVYQGVEDFVGSHPITSF